MAMTEKNKQAALVAGILGGAVFLVVCYFHFFTVVPEAGQNAAKVAKLQKEIADNRKQLKDFEMYLADKELRREVEETFSRVNSRLPSNQDPIEVFDILRGYFEGTDVAFSYLEPGVPVPRGRVSERPFTIRGLARYHEFGQLVNLIECNPERLMRVVSFKLTNNPKRPSIHPMEVGIATFTFNEQ